MDKEFRQPDHQQAAIIFANGLNSRNWLVKSDDGEKLTIVYKYGKSQKELDKKINIWERSETACHIMGEPVSI